MSKQIVVLALLLTGCSITSNKVEDSASHALESIADLASVSQGQIATVGSTVVAKLDLIRPIESPVTYWHLVAGAIIFIILHNIHLHLKLNKVQDVEI